MVSACTTPLNVDSPALTVTCPAVISTWLPWMVTLDAACTVTPDEFKAYEAIARAKGFLMVSSSPLTRSSHHAGEDFERLRAARAAKGK